MVQRMSHKRRCWRTLRRILVDLNNVPYEIRKSWGSDFGYSNYDWLIELVDSQLKKIDDQLERVKRGRKNEGLG